ncbi:PREDICTED: uncharacterized protein LOC109222220 [Nicotiana attenuata]|uniref:Uncharacterized protein n=1 Tax=Nicotiana attenuata TaxID=49451 RepID=A0A1J6KHL8_NICAT|nr:PREDICTED: uncharacterized protein LOC109222220 [Nicotiana attenuata]OIT18833.1 hypothetical protein A4A49_43375 [Nicotiana attenuata]
MCSSNSKLQRSSSADNITTQTISHINGRPVLQPNRNQLPFLERRNSLKNSPAKTFAGAPLHPLSSPRLNISPPSTTNGNNNNKISAKIKPFVTTPPISPKIKSPRQPAIKRDNDPHGLNSSAERVVSPKDTTKTTYLVKKSKNSSGVPCAENSSLKYSSSLIVEAPGSIAAARREQVANMQVQRKMRIAHYGRTKSAKFEGKVSAAAFHLLLLLLPLPPILEKKKDAALSQLIRIKKEFGSFNKYLWGFVNNKPIATQYKACNKIPVKTSKSESISKDMVKRGFRYVGPTVIHSFMQAAGLTNDHLTTCPRHLQCVTLATQPPSTQ